MWAVMSVIPPKGGSETSRIAATICVTCPSQARTTSGLREGLMWWASDRPSVQRQK